MQNAETHCNLEHFMPPYCEEADRVCLVLDSFYRSEDELNPTHVVFPSLGFNVSMSDATSFILMHCIIQKVSDESNRLTISKSMQVHSDLHCIGAYAVPGVPVIIS